VERRISAIFAADMVGYSRLMEADEEGTLARQKQHREELFDPKITAHGGKVVKLTGDGMIAEFPSVVEAVKCAVSIQKEMVRRETDETEDRRISYRLAVNLGDVIFDENDVFGDGVNIAARLESLAEPGGIVVSGMAHDHLKSNVPVRYEPLGELQLKNISQPVRAFRVTELATEIPAAPRPRSGNKKSTHTAVATLILVAFGVYWLWSSTQTQNPETPAPNFIASAKPSVAVLPFDNLSGDENQAYFSDGMTDNLITDLSRVGGLLVIARNTSFSFRERDETEDAQSVGEILGVRYIVEGSVQRAGDHVRVNASLIDTDTGYQVWAGRLDKEFSSLFALQDEVTQQIIDALHIQLTRDERQQLSKRYTRSLEAYDLYLRAWEEIWRFNEDARVAAQAYLGRALEIDPNFALAKALLATTYTNRNGVALVNNDAMLKRGLDLAQEAVALDPDLPAVQSALGLVLMFQRDYAASDAAFERAIDLDPNYADAIAMQAWNRHYRGDLTEALEGFERALQLNPRAPFPYWNALAEINFSLGNYERSLEINKIAISRNPEGLRQRIFMAAAYVKLGHFEDAKWEVEEALALQPELTIFSLNYIAPYKDASQLYELSAALRKAGLPE
jgi:adenylate cyclase